MSEDGKVPHAEISSLAENLQRVNFEESEALDMMYEGYLVKGVALQNKTENL